VHGVQMPYSPPGPPSSQSPSLAKMHVLMQVPEPGGPGAGLGLGGGRGLRGMGERRGGLGGGRVHEPGRRGPQSAQSVQGEQNAYSFPTPPSSQSPSPAKMHELEHVSWVPGGNGGGGEGRGGGGLWLKEQPERGPQSAQSVHGVQMPYSAPLPPSSQSPSEA